MAAKLQLDDVHVYLGDSYVVQGVSLVVAEARSVVILGRNGVGKTTLMRAVMGLTETPRRGTIQWADHHGHDLDRGGSGGSFTGQPRDGGGRQGRRHHAHRGRRHGSHRAPGQRDRRRRSGRRGHAADRLDRPGR